MATTTISEVELLYVSLETTITGRRRTELKSVKGTGTNAISPWLGIVPILVIQRVVPKIGAGGSRLDEIGKLVRFRGQNQDFDLCAKRQRHADFQFAVRPNFRFELESTLGHFQAFQVGGLSEYLNRSTLRNFSEIIGRWQGDVRQPFHEFLAIASASFGRRGANNATQKRHVAVPPYERTGLSGQLLLRCQTTSERNSHIPGFPNDEDANTDILDPNFEVRFLLSAT